jgi:hypothetical protein
MLLLFVVTAAAMVHAASASEQVSKRIKRLFRLHPIVIIIIIILNVCWT